MLRLRVGSDLIEEKKRLLICDCLLRSLRFEDLLLVLLWLLRFLVFCVQLFFRSLRFKMEQTHGKFEMDKFDRKGDFGMWKYKMMAQLEIQGLLAVIQNDFVVTAASEKQEEGEKPKVDPKKFDKDLRVKSLLCTCLSDSILRKIMHEQTALGMWKSLEKLYQLKSLPNMIYLKRQFSCYKMEGDKSIEENVDVFLKLIADLESLKVTVTDEDQAIQLLSGLPAAYEQLVHTL